MSSVTTDNNPVDSGGNDATIHHQLGGDDHHCNVMLLLASALSTFSSSQMQVSAVQAQTTLQETQVEISLSDKEMAQLQSLTDDMNAIINDPKGKTKGTYTDTQQNELSSLNTQFSMAMQGGNMNVQTLQGLVQGSQSAEQMTVQGIQAIGGMFSSVSQALSYVSSLITQQ